MNVSVTPKDATGILSVVKTTDLNQKEYGGSPVRKRN